MSKQLQTDNNGMHYQILGVDWSKKTMGIPTWGWAGALAGAAYYFFFRKGRR